jgi:hypothetical protein
LFREEPVFCIDALIVVGEWFGGGVRFDDGVRWIVGPFAVWSLWSSVVFSFIFRDFSVIWGVLCFYINEIPTPSQKKTVRKCSFFFVGLLPTAGHGVLVFSNT